MERFSGKEQQRAGGDLGNFVNRALVLTQKYFDNKVPHRAKLEPIDEAAIEALTVYRRVLHSRWSFTAFARQRQG